MKYICNIFDSKCKYKKNICKEYSKIYFNVSIFHTLCFWQTKLNGWPSFAKTYTEMLTTTTYVVWLENYRHGASIYIIPLVIAIKFLVSKYKLKVQSGDSSQTWRM